MSEEKKYAKGFRIFAPREGSPDFVIGKAVVDPREFTDFMASMVEHFSEYKGKKQLKFDILSGSKGMYMVVDTYKPKEKTSSSAPQADDLPF